MVATAPWTTLLAVALGSAVGGMLRWWVGLWLNPVWAGFPLGTLLVNCVGGFLIGAALIGFEQWPLALPRAVVVTGLLGGLTTFSAFSGESLQLLQRGQATMAALHAAAHVIGSLACAAVGFALARLILRA